MPRRLLTIIRHGKASAEHRGGGRDYERDLAARGERDVVRMGKRLAKAGVSPDWFLSSAALRAERTARAIAAELGHPDDRIATDEDLYLASQGRLLSAVQATSSDVRHLALVGHNPGLSDLWGTLTGELDTDLPTCGIARLALEAEDWADVQPGTAELIEFDYPKRLED